MGLEADPMIIFLFYFFKGPGLVEYITYELPLELQQLDLMLPQNSAQGKTWGCQEHLLSEVQASTLYQQGTLQ